jgi:hypothetical protein
LFDGLPIYLCVWSIIDAVQENVLPLRGVYMADLFAKSHLKMAVVVLALATK